MGVISGALVETAMATDNKLIHYKIKRYDYSNTLNVIVSGVNTLERAQLRFKIYLYTDDRKNEKKECKVHESVQFFDIKDVTGMTIIIRAYQVHGQYRKTFEEIGEVN